MAAIHGGSNLIGMITDLKIIFTRLLNAGLFAIAWPAVAFAIWIAGVCSYLLGLTPPDAQDWFGMVRPPAE